MNAYKQTYCQVGYGSSGTESHNSSIVKKFVFHINKNLIRQVIIWKYYTKVLNRIIAILDEAYLMTIHVTNFIFLIKLNWSIVFWHYMSKSYLKLVWYPSIRYLVFHLISQCSIEQPASIKKLPQYLITKLQLSNDILMVVVERRNNVYMNCYRDFAFAKKNFVKR